MSGIGEVLEGICGEDDIGSLRGGVDERANLIDTSPAGPIRGPAAIPAGGCRYR
jgi:hypothetical protein